MLVAGDVIRALVVSCAIDGHARIVSANVVFWRRTAIQNYGIAFIFGVPRYNDARSIVIRTLRMLATVDSIGTFIGTGAKRGNTLTVGITHSMEIFAAPFDGIATTYSFSLNNYTNFPVTPGTLKMAVAGRPVIAFIRTATG